MDLPMGGSPEVFETDNLKITAWPLGPYMTNCYLVQLQAGGNQCLVIDCGVFPSAMLDHMKSEGLVPEKLLLTHAHVDHIAGIEELYQTFGLDESSLPMLGHETEKALLENPNLNLSMQFGVPVTITRTLTEIDEGAELQWQGHAIKVLHVPGHSPGSLCFYFPEDAVAFVGDTLFSGSVGRTDLPFGDTQQLLSQIKEKLFTLPGETRVYPGHNEATTIEREKQSNPFLA